MRLGMDVVRSTGAERELSALPVRPPGLSQLRELRRPVGASVPRSPGGTGVGKAPGQFLRILRVHAPRFCASGGGKVAFVRGARADKEAVRGLVLGLVKRDFHL